LIFRLLMPVIYWYCWHDIDLAHYWHIRYYAIAGFRHSWYNIWHYLFSRHYVIRFQLSLFRWHWASLWLILAFRHYWAGWLNILPVIIFSLFAINDIFTDILWIAFSLAIAIIFIIWHCHWYFHWYSLMFQLSLVDIAWPLFRYITYLIDSHYALILRGHYFGWLVIDIDIMIIDYILYFIGHYFIFDW